MTIVDKTDTPNLDDLFQMEFITTTTDDDGKTVNETHTLGEFASRTNGNAMRPLRAKTAPARSA